MPQAARTTGILLFLAFLMSGCGGGGSNDVAQQPPPVAEPPPPTPTPPPPPPGPASGLDARPSNPTCIAPARATGDATISTERVFPNLQFKDAAGASRNPVLALQAPGD